MTEAEELATLREIVATLHRLVGHLREIDARKVARAERNQRYYAARQERCKSYSPPLTDEGDFKTRSKTQIKTRTVLNSVLKPTDTQTLESVIESCLQVVSCELGIAESRSIKTRLTRRLKVPLDKEKSTENTPHNRDLTSSGFSPTPPLPVPSPSGTQSSGELVSESACARTHTREAQEPTRGDATPPSASKPTESKAPLALVDGTPIDVALDAICTGSRRRFQPFVGLGLLPRVASILRAYKATVDDCTAVGVAINNPPSWMHAAKAWANAPATIQLLLKESTAPSGETKAPLLVHLLNHGRWLRAECEKVEARTKQPTREREPAPPPIDMSDMRARLRALNAKEQAK